MNKTCYYHDYLKLDQLLTSQELFSELAGNPCPEEHLFIITHQSYELWFKQILFDFDRIEILFQQKSLGDQDLTQITRLIERAEKIFKMLMQNLDILESMTPMEFLDFRNLLAGASGFQSIQFKAIEFRLGLKQAFRSEIEKQGMKSRLNEEHQHFLKMAQEKLSILDGVDRWLSRTPFLKFGDYDFWHLYQKQVRQMLAEDAKRIEISPLPQKQKEYSLGDNQSSTDSFEKLFDEQEYQKLIDSGDKRISLKALQAALFILLYREHPSLIAPFRLIESLMNLDESITSWRYRHSLLAHRMLGAKIGTGGSSGHEYLKQTTQNNRIFRDFFDLSTFLIPSSLKPDLPDKLLNHLGPA